MAKAAACPSREELRQLALGLLPDPAAEAYAAHLERCPSCQAALKHLPLSDPLLDAVARVKAPTESRDIPAVQGLIDRLGGPQPDPAAARTAFDEQDDSVPDPAVPGLQAPTQLEPAPTFSGAELPPSLVGHPRYRILGVLGSGGMGAVYKAEHLLMQRPVALKVIGQELLQRPGAVERFLQEVKAAARLTHPNIVTAYDAEQAGDVHFLVMEYIEGVSLAQRLDQRGPLPVAEACGYVRQAALGLQHAHERRMAHRDIKPHNLMLTPDGQVKILDFGLARFVSENSENDGLTAPGTTMGTPDYIAPEQATDARRADVRADIYSLGCTLYCLLAGQPPFPTGSALEKAMAHRQDRPRPVTALRPEVPPALAAVVEKMLAKDPAGRYQTPVEVARALEPFTAGDTRRRARRWPLLLGATAAAALLAVAAAVLYVVTDQGTLVLESNDKDVEVAVRQGDVTITDLKTSEKVRLKAGTYEVTPAGDRPGLKVEPNHVTISRGREVIVKATWEKGGKPAVAAAAPPPAPAPEPVDPIEVAHFSGHLAQVNRVAFSPDGRHALSGGSDRFVSLWDVAVDVLVRRFRGSTESVWALAFSPDGKHALSGGGGVFRDGKWLPGEDFTVYLTDIATGKEVRRFQGHTGQVRGIAFTPDGRQALSGGADKTLRLWDVRSGDLVRAFPAGCVVNGLAVSPDGRLALSAGWDGSVRLWQLDNGREVRSFAGHPDPVLSVAFSPDGRQALSGGLDGTMRLWDVDSGREVRTFPVPTGVGCVAFSPDGRRALCGSGLRHKEGGGYVPANGDDCVRVWDVAGGRELGRFDGRGHGVISAAFAPDGRLILANDGDRGVRLLWLAGRGEEHVPSAPGTDPAARGRLVLESSVARVVLQVRQRGNLVTVLHTPEVPAADLPAGEYALALGSGQEGLTLGQAKLVVPPGGAVVATVRPNPMGRPVQPLSVLHTLVGHRGLVHGVAVSRDGSRLLSAGNDRTLRLWDPAGGTESRVFYVGDPVRCLALSPDGKRALAGILPDAGAEHTLRLWDLVAGKEVRRFVGHTALVSCVAFSPDGRQALSGSLDRTVRLWDVQTGDTLQVYAQPRVVCVAFAPDGRSAVAGVWDGKLHLWDLPAGKHRRVFEGHTGPVLSVAFSPDGRQVLSGSLDRTMRLWQVEGEQPLGVFQHPTGLRTVAFAPDGKRALSGSGYAQQDQEWVTAGADAAVRLWDLKTGAELAHGAGDVPGVSAVAFAPDGRTAVAATGTVLRVLKLPE
jgi:WD40 repeat protein